MTRYELDELRAVFGSLGQALTRLGDMIVEAQREFAAEDKVNTALDEQQGADNDDKQRPF